MATRFEREVLARIPLAAAMQIRVAECGPARFVLAAPLAPNLNHEGIAFGGAIECLGTLACWGLLWRTLEAPDALIVIQHGEIEFLAPITRALRAEAPALDTQTRERFTQQFARHGRARIEAAARIGDANQPEAARFHGRFVAKRKTSPQNTHRQT